MIAVFMVMLFYDTDVLVEAEDGAGKEEGLGDVVEQTGGDVVDVDHLVGHERDTAHDEQHRTCILRDFEARVFHSIRCFVYSTKVQKKSENAKHSAKIIIVFLSRCHSTVY